MRTTLTLDDDVAYQLSERQRLTGMSYKEVVNATLRAGLQGAQQPAAPPPPFRVTPKAAGFRVGVDVLRLNQLNDELESEGFLRDLAGTTGTTPTQAVILPDINLLVYAYNSDAPGHARARAWWEATLSAPGPVGLPWVVMLGYLRLVTNRSVLIDPFAPAEAISHIRSWLERPQVLVLGPGSRHLDLLEELMAAAHASGQHTTDVHLAALAIEHQAELFSNDADFSRFPGLRWTDPLA